MVDLYTFLNLLELALSTRISATNKANAALTNGKFVYPDGVLSSYNNTVSPSSVTYKKRIGTLEIKGCQQYPSFSAKVALPSCKAYEKLKRSLIH
jgi:hypothetical protein